jgi:hypothetical protein
MKKIILLFILTGFLSTKAFSQARYIVRLKDKGTSPYSLSNPSAYLTPRAIARRTRYNIAIDSLDMPVTPRYIDSIRLAGSVTIVNVSKWLNQVAIQTNDAAAINKINGFPFVAAVFPVATGFIQPVNKNLDAPNTSVSPSPLSPQSPSDFYNYGQSYG